MMPPPVTSGESLREAGLAPPQPTSGRWRHALSLFGSYWLSRAWKEAWAALIVLIVIQFGTASLMFAYNRWQQAFFDSVTSRDVARLSGLIVALIAILGAQAGTLLLDSFLTKYVGIQWRTALTHRYLDGWLSRHRFAEIERLALIDNPDQRIADDINLVTGPGGILALLLGLLYITVSAIGFAMILLETAPPLHLSLFGMGLSIPGSTIWYAALYVLAGSVATALVGRPFIRANMRQQHREADFRSNLIHVRRNAQQISFIGAIATEAASLAQAFEQVRWNFRSVIRTTLSVQAIQFVYERVRTVLPLFLLIPRYFAGAITFGQVMAGRDAFEQLASQLSYFVQAYPQIGVQIASINRLKALDDAIDARRPRGIAHRRTDEPAEADAVIVTRDLHLHRPAGAPMLAVGDWTVRAGERWLVEGPSGAGKSTLLRAVAGLWPDGRGDVRLAIRGTAMFVPQRLYLPLGTLKTAICFPDPAEAHDDTDIVEMLGRVGLGIHAANLHAVRFWQDELSPGEQQRIALARILLHRPSLLVLDEATSALDPANAALFHEAVMALPGLTLVSVAHDERLAVFHTHALSVTPDGVRTHAFSRG